MQEVYKAMLKHNLESSDIAHLKSLKDQGKVAEAWQYLASKGDSYADDAAAVTGLPTTPIGMVMNILVKQHWLNTAGAQAYQDDFHSVAKMHLTNYIGYLDGGSDWPDQEQIETSYLLSVQQHDLTDYTAFDGVFAQTITKLLPDVQWTDFLQIEPGREVPSEVFSHLDSLESWQILVQDLTDTLQVLHQQNGSDTLDFWRSAKPLIDAASQEGEAAVEALMQKLRADYQRLFEAQDAQEGIIRDLLCKMTFACPEGIRVDMGDLLGEAPPAPLSPIILDLDGDGVETIGTESGAYFDHANDGFREASGFAASDDGLLALDLNQNGKIDSGRELFGNETRLPNGKLAAHGFAALKALDTNQDNLIDAKDEAFAALRIFRDFNQNGRTDAGELFTLKELGIRSLDLAYQFSQYVDAAGNAHRQVGQYTTDNGETRTMTDVWFDRELSNTRETERLPVSDEVKSLPNMHGMGNAHSLHQAMMHDDSGHLQSLLEQYQNATTRDDRNALIEPIIFAWTGQSGDYRDYMGAPIDARRIGALSVLYGTPVDDPLNRKEDYAFIF